MCSILNAWCFRLNTAKGLNASLRSIKEWVSFFLGSWEMNRSAEQTNRVNRESVLVRFVCSALRFISHEPRKKDTHSLYLQCLQQRFLLKFSEQSKKFKFPSEIGNLTLFPDRSQNSAWINGGKGDLSCMFFNSHFNSNNINSIIELNYMNFFYKWNFVTSRVYRVPGRRVPPFQPIGIIETFRNCYA